MLKAQIGYQKFENYDVKENNVDGNKELLEHLSVLKADKVVERFFDFYINEFQPRDHMINLSGFGDIILQKNEKNIKQCFNLRYTQYKKHAYQNHYYLIREFFDNTYNPAKNKLLPEVGTDDEIKRLLIDGKKTLCV